MKTLFILMISIYISVALGNDLSPFMLESESIIELNRRIGKQRNAVASIRRIDQRRHREGRYKDWFKERPHAHYQKIMQHPAPIVKTDPAPEEIMPFYAIKPQERRLSRKDWKDRRTRDRSRFYTHDRHMSTNGKTLYQILTGRYNH